MFFIYEKHDFLLSVVAISGIVVFSADNFETELMLGKHKFEDTFEATLFLTLLHCNYNVAVMFRQHFINLLLYIQYL